ncbi:MAG: hypothetical protein KAG53_07830 [Endozoicomonadaceae bacterium]|nr:hypothetical protein [Endozoicomonadaceae bacterium]
MMSRTKENTIDYVVWPALMMESDGKKPIVIKGIYQAKSENIINCEMRKRNISSDIGKEIMLVKTKIKMLTIKMKKENENNEHLKSNLTTLWEAQKNILYQISSNENYTKNLLSSSSDDDDDDDDDEWWRNENSSYQLCQNMITELQQLKESNRLLQEWG